MSMNTQEKRQAKSPLLSSQTACDEVRVIELIDLADTSVLFDTLNSITPADTGRLLRGLSTQNAVRFWELMGRADIEFAAELLDHLPDLRVAAIVTELPITIATDLLIRMESDDRRDVVGLLDDLARERVLEGLPLSLAEALRLELSLSPATVGGILKTEVLRFDQRARVADVVSMLRSSTEQLELFEMRYIYLFGDGNRYVGTVPLRNLLLAAGDRPLKELLDTEFPTVPPDLPLSELKSLFDHVRFSVFPVVDGDGKQIGVVDHKDLQEALFEQAERDLLEQGGILGGEELRGMPLLPRVLRRLAFLLPSVALSYAAVSVIAMYEPVIDQLVILAAFLPLVANLSGAAGNQAVAVSIRELSVDRISSRSMGYVVLKELPIGLFNGLVVGLILAGLSILRSDESALMLPVVIAGAYAISSVLAVIIGGSLPLLLKRLGLDPAMLASPLLTTMTDAVAFFFVLFMAQAVLLG